MLHRSLASFSRRWLTWVAIAGAGLGGLAAQDLVPAERAALAARAQGAPADATRAFLTAATTACRAPLGAEDAARIEAWGTVAARLARATADRAALADLDALGAAAAAAGDPLLADRLAIAALELAETLPDSGAAARADRLGFLRGGWLCGPFANERGGGFPQQLPPERELDLDAELPGKRRGVRWRALPVRPGSPALPLAAIVHPHEQSLVYLAHDLFAERATAAVLELGSTGSWAVFCNGEKVAAREVERPFAYDQDAVVLSLVAGHNLLLLKLGHQEGDDFTAAARVRGLDGASLAGVRWLDGSAALREAAATRGAPRAAPPPAASLGGRTTWPIGAARGADALRLAWLWRAREADGDRDRRDALAAEAAVAALPDLAESWLVLAASRLRHGRSSADRDDNERRRALATAAAKDRNHVEAKVQLGNLLRDSSNLWRDARQLADEALAVQPASLPALFLRCNTLRDEGLPELADAELLRAAPTSRRPELWRAAASLLAEREPAAAMAYREKVLAVSTAELDLTAAILQAQRVGAALPAAAIDPWLVDPCARQLHRQRAELLLAQGDAPRAIAVLERWLAVAPDDADAMVLVARAWRQLRPGDPTAHERQLERLREVLQIEPSRRDDERYAEFVASDAPGAATADAAFHAPFQVDAAAVVRADPGPPADAAAAHDPLHWLLRQQVVRANGNGTTNVYRHDIVRVLTADGARALRNYELPAYRGEQRARLRACTVFRADGSVEKPALQGARVRLPDLRPGDVVAVEGRIDDLAPTFFGDYFGLEHTFGSPEGSPVQKDELVVLAAPGREYRWQAAQGAPEPERTTAPDGTLQLRFAMHDLGRDRPEIRRPKREERDPTVRITTYRDWDQFASWWWSLIKNQLEVSPAMRQTVQDCCRGLSSTEAKIAAIYRFVTTDVRYEAWEFGVHGYKPYSTAVIHERRHGDCKDKALLLCALLGEIGVPCRPVLIFADPLRSRDDLTLPMIEHFNHCIAWLPPHEGRAGRFLDGTAVWHPTDTLPDMDQGATVLVVDAGRAELRQVPWTTPDANRQQRSWTLDLAADGSAVLRQEDRPLGNEAVALREMLATEPARLREVVEASLVRTFGKATLRSVVPSTGTDAEAPVQLTLTASLPEPGQRGPHDWQLPSSWAADDLLALTTDRERSAPLLLGVPSGAQQTLRYNLPPGYRPGELPADVARTAPFGTFTMQWRRDGDAVVVERRVAWTSPRIEVAQHAAFRDFVAAMQAADSQLVLLQKEGAR